MDETQTALRIAQAIDQLYSQAGPATDVLQVEWPGEEQGLLAVAGRLAALNHTLGPVTPGLEQRVVRLVQPAAERSVPRRLPWQVISPRWRLAAAVVVIVVAGLLVLPGRATLARFGGTISVGPVEVRFVPVAEPTAHVHPVTTAERHFDSLAGAEALIGRPLLRPALLPGGYILRDVAVVYDDAMPRWLGQPLFVDSSYQTGDKPARRIDLREYFIALGPGRDLQSLRYSDDQVRQATPVEVGGQQGILLTLQNSIGTGAPAAPLLVIIWQQDGLLLELSAPGEDTAEQGPTTDALLGIARSVK